MQDKVRLSSQRKLAELLDNRFRIPSTNIRFGIDPVLGLIPGAGDWIGGAISVYFMFYAVLLGAKASVLGRMFVNILMDVMVGAIPVLGDVFDVYFKANVRNAKILEELEQNPEKTTNESRYWVWTVFVQFVLLIVGILLLIGWLVIKLFDLAI